MDDQIWINVISSVGFPIVACYFMWKYINTTLKDFSQMMQKNNESINALCDKLDLILIKALGGETQEHEEQ